MGDGDDWDDWHDWDDGDMGLGQEYQGQFVDVCGINMDKWLINEC